MATTSLLQWTGKATFQLNDSVTAGAQDQPVVASNSSGTEYFAGWVTPDGGAPQIEGRFVHNSATPFAGEFLVNSTTAGTQTHPSVAALPDGRFIVVFADTSSDPGGDIRARLFNADGTPAGVDFGVNTSASDDFLPDVTALPAAGDGGYAVTWTRDFGNGDHDLYVKVYNADGTMRVQRVVNDNVNNTSFSSVTGLVNGGFVVAWEEHPAAGTDLDVRFRVFDANGNPLNGTDATGVLIDNIGTVNMDIQVAALPNGGFVVTYADNGWNISGTEISAQLFNADGSAITPAPFRVNTTTNGGTTTGDQSLPQVTVLSNGYIMIGWHSGSEFAANVFDAFGGPVDVGTFALLSNQQESAIAALDSGRIAVVGESLTSDGGGHSIRSRTVELFRVTTGDGAADFFSGDSLRDIIDGAGGVDILFGGGGNDEITGGASADFMSGGAGDDIFVYSANVDILNETVDGDAGNDTLRFVGSDFYSFLSATLASIESLEFNTQATAVFTSAQFAGITSVKGSLGHDELRIGGTTVDLSSVSFSSWSASDTVSIFGNSGVDNLIGSNQADSFFGFAGADTFHGNGGDDIFNFAPGHTAPGEFVDGGNGTDTLRLDTAGQFSGTFDFSEVTLTSIERLEFNAVGKMSATFNASQIGAGGISSVVSAAGPIGNAIVVNGQNVDLSGVVFEDWGEGDKITINGTAGNDVLHGSNMGETINGGAGDDTAVFSHNAVDYVARHLGSVIIVTGPEGSDVLHDIEHLQFADGIISPEDGNSLFDTAYYLTRNADVFHAGMNALQHFNQFGWHEGRNPSLFFSVNGYLTANPSVAAANINPLDHYHQTGWQQGRDPSQNFDTTRYLLKNPDVAAAHVDPLEHYLANGFAEGRSRNDAIGTVVKGFDAEWYAFHNPDVAAAHVDPLAHFNANGWHEGRNPNAWFDTAGYLAHYADVAASGMNPLTHYEQFGWLEGRDPSAFFDTNGYLAANPDVAAAHINPLDHFINNGIYEGRAAVNDGLWH